MRPWQALIAGCAVLAVPMGAAPGTVVASGAYLAGLCLIIFSLIFAARRLQAGQHRCWLPWIAGMGCATAGAGISQAAPLFTASEVPGNLALVCWIAFYLPMPLAIFRMIEKRAVPRPERVAIAKDVVVVTAAAALFAWDALIRPAVTGPQTLDWWNLLTTLAFPLGDVLVVVLALTVLLLPGRRTGSERLMVAGFGAMLLVDIVNAMAPSTVADINSWATAAYLVIHATLTAAVLRPDRDGVNQPARRGAATPGLRGWRMTMLGASLCAVGLSAIYLPHPDQDRAPAAAAMLVMVTVILSRLHRALADLGAAERTLRHQAGHDQLTGLANRARLMDEIGHQVHEAPTLFFVDLDGFKAVNDTHGHHAGDTVLKEVAQRLTATVRRSDTVARFGGDEFVLVCSGLAETDVPGLAARINEALTAPIVIEGGPVSVGASIGVLTLQPEMAADGQPADEVIGRLFRAADAAMYEAKREGGGIRMADYAMSA